MTACYELKLIRVPITDLELVVPPRIYDPYDGALSGIQYAAEFRRPEASDQCPICTVVGPHAHDVEEIDRLEEMIAFLKSKFGITTNLETERKTPLSQREALIGLAAGFMSETNHALFTDAAKALLAKHGR